MKGNSGHGTIACVPITVRVDDLGPTFTNAIPHPAHASKADNDYCVVDKVAGHEFVDKKAPYTVKWYRYSARDDTVKLEENLGRHIFTTFWNKQNRQSRRV